MSVPANQLCNSTMKSKKFTNLEFFQISVFWFAVSFQWGGILGIFLQKQVLEFVPPDRKGLYYSLLAGSGAIVAALVQLVIGTLSDRSRSDKGRRMPYIFWGTLLSTIPMLFMGISKSFALLTASFMGLQIFANIAGCPFKTLIPELVPKDQQGMASAWMSIFQILGQAAGPVFAGVIMSRTNGGLDLMIFTAVVVNLVMLYTVVFVKDPGKGEKNNAPPSPEGNPLKEIFTFPFKEYPDFTWIVISRAFVNMGFYTALGFFMYYLKDSLKLADYETKTGILLMTITIGGIFLAYPAGIMADKYSKKKILFISGSFAGFMALGFSFLHSYPLVLTLGFILGMAFGALATVDWALLCNHIPKEKAGKFMAVWNLTYNIPQIIAPLIAGFPSDYINRVMGLGAGYRAVLALVFVYIVGGLLSLIPVREGRRVEELQS